MATDKYSLAFDSTGLIQRRTDANPDQVVGAFGLGKYTRLAAIKGGYDPDNVSV